MIRRILLTISRNSIPLVLLGILLVASYLRLFRISEYMTFLGDEGRDMLVIKRMIVDHKFTLLGPTASVGGFFLGPVYYYFMLPFVWLWGLDPAGAAVMVALFGIATVYLLYRFVREAFDTVTGFITASLYAVSPLVIAYSRSSWNPNLVPFFSLLMMYLLWKAVQHRKPIFLFGAGAAAGIGLQLHYLFLFLLPVGVLYFFLSGRKSAGFRSYLFAVSGFVVGYGPFLAFELRHKFPNTIAIYRFLREGDGTGFERSSFLSTVGDVLYRLFGRLLYRLPPPEQWVNLEEISRVIWDSVIKFGIAASLFVAILYLAGKLRMVGAARSALMLLCVWLAVPLLLFGFYQKGIYDYYFGIFFVVPFIFTSLGLRTLAVTRTGTLAAIALSVALVYFNWLGRPFVYEPNNQLAQVRTIAREAFEKAEGKPFNFALITGGNSDHAYRFFFEIWGNPPVPIKNPDADPQRRSVTDQLIIICETAECKPLGHPLWEIAGFGQAEIEGEWQVSFVRILKLVHYSKD